MTMLSNSMVAAALLLHPGHHPEQTFTTPANWTHAWSWEPGIFIPLALSAVLYIVGVGNIYRRNSERPAIKRWEIACYALGWLSLFIALDSPLHKMGEVLFSAHMTQHEVLMVIAAPLLALGRPLIAFLFAFPLRTREKIASWTTAAPIRRTWLLLTGPLTVWLVHGVTIWIWHIPALYQATLDDEFVHALQHISFLATALLFWFTLIHGRYGRLGYGVAFAYVFTTALHTSVLGALMTFTNQLWYPIYDGRTTPWHLTPMEDQQLGGLIMWIPSGTVFIIVGLALFAAWIGEAERRQKLSSFAHFASAPTGGHDAD